MRLVLAMLLVVASLAPAVDALVPPTVVCPPPEVVRRGTTGFEALSQCFVQGCTAPNATQTCALATCTNFAWSYTPRDSAAVVDCREEFLACAAAGSAGFLCVMHWCYPQVVLRPDSLGRSADCAVATGCVIPALPRSCPPVFLRPLS